MTAERVFKFKSAGGGYEVYDIATGTLLGTVRSWERRYNLNRVVLHRGWRATTTAGEKLYHEDSCTGETRHEAAEALKSKAVKA